jgi:protocatechuate 3,4-dioxygenase beta subunit
MKRLLFLFVIIISLHTGGCGQSNQTGKKVGGGCEGCEVIFTSPVPFEKLNPVDTLPDFNEPGPKLVISGIVYKSDGETAAKDIVIYFYHTDQTGHYTNKYTEKGYAGKNGCIKGWIKTNEKGEYKIYTLKPAAYPGTNIPAHIHPVIKEPGKNEYYIDEFLFEDDPFLTDPNAANRN